MHFNEDYIDYVEDRKGHDRRYSMDSTKIKEDIGWSPKHDFDSAMELTVQWYKDNIKWWKKFWAIIPSKCDACNALCGRCGYYCNGHKGIGCMDKPEHVKINCKCDKRS